MILEHCSRWISTSSSVNDTEEKSKCPLRVIALSIEWVRIMFRWIVDALQVQVHEKTRCYLRFRVDLQVFSTRNYSVIGFLGMTGNNLVSTGHWSATKRRKGIRMPSWGISRRMDRTYNHQHFADMNATEFSLVRIIWITNFIPSGYHC